KASMPPSERVKVLRAQLDDSLAQREALYEQQHDLLERQKKFENESGGQHAANILETAQYQARFELYRETLDQADPEVKRYFKDRAAHDTAVAEKKTELA